MTSPTNVLAVMADAIRYETKASAAPAWIAELQAARAAVAELIEATSGLIEFVEPILTAHGFGYVGRIEKARKALSNVGAQP